MRLLFTIIVFLLIGCTKPKTVLICGDHICVNKKEANQYFEENLSLEVKILNKDNKKNFDLVELNLREDFKKNKKVFVKKKDKTKKIIKKLSNKEIKVIKSKINNKEKNKKKIKIIDKERKLKNKVDKKKIVNNVIDNETDICTIIEKCSIDEISKYLTKEGNKRGYPDISIKK